MKLRLTAIFLILTLSLCSLTQIISKAKGTSTLELTLTTDKETYGFGSLVQLFGNLTYDGTPVEDGLVAIQIEDPSGYILATRTLDTGTTPLGNWQVEILGVTTLDFQGNPKNTFEIGETLYIKITLKNNLQTPKNCWITATVLDADQLPIGVQSQGQIPAGISEPWLPLQLSSGLTPGQATVFAGVYTKPIKDKGLAYSPEKNTTFTITSSSQSSSTKTEPKTTLPGSFSFTFRIYKNYVRVGNYTIYATSQYQIIFITANSTQFQVILKGDLNNDGAVNILDCLIVAVAMGSVPGSPNWNPKADTNGDEKVDILDMIAVAVDYGKRTAT
jgi:hypothetical protein